MVNLSPDHKLERRQAYASSIENFALSSKQVKFKAHNAAILRKKIEESKQLYTEVLISGDTEKSNEFSKSCEVLFFSIKESELSLYLEEQFSLPPNGELNPLVET